MRKLSRNILTPLHCSSGVTFCFRPRGQRFTLRGCTHTSELGSPVSNVSLHYGTSYRLEVYGIHYICTRTCWLLSRITSYMNGESSLWLSCVLDCVFMVTSYLNAWSSWSLSCVGSCFSSAAIICGTERRLTFLLGSSNKDDASKDDLQILVELEGEILLVLSKLLHLRYVEKSAN